MIICFDFARLASIVQKMTKAPIRVNEKCNAMLILISNLDAELGVK